MLRDGSHETFARAFRRFYAPILRYVEKRVSDPETANDLTQEIFLKAYRFRDQYRPEYAFSTWLWTIARNTVLDHLRSGGANPGARLDERSEISPEDLPAPLHDAESHLLQRDRKAIILRTLERLTIMQRRVVWLRVVEHRTFPEIADRLHLSLSSVKNLALRARRTLLQGARLELV